MGEGGVGWGRVELVVLVWGTGGVGGRVELVVFVWGGVG